MGGVLFPLSRLIYQSVCQEKRSNVVHCDSHYRMSSLLRGYFFFWIFGLKGERERSRMGVNGGDERM